MYEQAYGEKFPSGVQTAENLFQHVVDDVVPVEALRAVLHRHPDGDVRLPLGRRRPNRRRHRRPTCRPGIR